MSRKPTILAVDDVPANLLAVEAVLDRDFNIIRASSGPEAIQVLTDGVDVDVVLLDVQMPGMDGYEVAERIKQLPQCHDVPIVFITAVFNEDPHVKRGYSAGGVDYFTKPFDPALLKLKLGIYASFRLRGAVLKERELQIKEAEEVLRAGRRLSALLEKLPVGVLIADAEGRICQSNHEVSRICESDEVLNQDVYGQLINWWDSDGGVLKQGGSPLERALHGKHAEKEFLSLRCVDGSLKSVLTSASPLFGVDGHVIGAVVVIQDASEVREIELEIESRIARLVSLSVEHEQRIQH